MNTKELIDAAVDHLATSASAKTVYGEPTVVNGKTFIPVAKVTYGFGGGSGMGKRPAPNGNTKTTPAGATPAATGEGEGVGGGLIARPVGIVEIDGKETKFVPIGLTKKLTIAAGIGSAVGLVLGLLLGRRSKT